MTSTTRSRKPTEINLLQSLPIGYAVWLISSCAQWIISRPGLKRALYDCVFVLVVHGLALLVLGIVYRSASSRGLSLKMAGAVSLVAAVPVIAISYLVDYEITKWDNSLSWDPQSRAQITLGGTLVMALCDSIGICLLLAAIVFLPAIARANEEHRTELELLRREAEVMRVRTHLEPHFILNSLNAVAGLVEEDPTQARELLAALGDLFREAVAFRAIHRVGDEIEWAKRYVTIHELRYPDTLQPSWDVDDACLDLACPALILQPLVENAIKHGALRGNGLLAVRASLAAGTLTFSIEDDGPELGEPRAGGCGLEITRRRLELETTSPSAFELVREGSHTVARLRLPAREHHADV